LLAGVLLAGLLGCGPDPVKVEIVPDKVVLEGSDAKIKLEAKVLDKEGKPITEGVDIVWFSDDQERIKLSVDGTVAALASGESKVQVEVVGTKLTAEVPIRVKIPASINVSHERLRLWTGQVKDNVWAEVHSEKGAFIEGYKPNWVSDDPDIVKLEPIKDARRQSFVRMTGMKSGTTYIYAKFKHFSKRIRVAVYDEDEEVALDGTRITKEQKEAKEKAKAEKEKERAKKKGKK
jgi:hypothetical protein